MTKFADQLFTDLMREHGPALENAGPLTARGGRPRMRHAALLGGAAATLAVGLTVGLTVFDNAATPAYAVTQHPDGTVTVALTRLSGVPGANQQLRTLGKRVVLVPVGAGCPSIGSLPAPKVSVPGASGQKSGGAVSPARGGPVRAGSGEVTSGGYDGSGSGTVTGNKDGSVSVQAQDIPAGDLLVLAVSSTGHATQMSGRLTSPPAPSCVSLPARPAGSTVRTGPAHGSASVRKQAGGQGQSLSDG